MPEDLKLTQEAVDVLENNDSLPETLKVIFRQLLIRKLNAPVRSSQKMKCNLKIAKVELVASKSLIRELERTIENQELIINMFKSDYEFKVKHDGETKNRFCNF